MAVSQRRRRRIRLAVSAAGLRNRNGVWYYEREHARLEGGRIFKSLGTRDIVLAQQYAAALNTLCERGDWAVLERWRKGELHISDIARAVREGEYAKLRRLTAEGTRLGPAVDKFLERTRATLKPRTLHTYTMSLGLLVAHLGADYPMAQLSTADAAAFLYAPKETAGGEVWSVRSQRNARTTFKALWSMVIEEEAEAADRANAVANVVRNPWKAVRVTKERQTRHAFLTPEQWQTLITHPEIEGTREAAFLGLACLAGLRQQEIAHLRPRDIDFEKAVVHVVDRKGEHAWEAKHEHSQRDVPIVPELRVLLEVHFESGFAGKRYMFRTYDRDRPIVAMTAQDWTRRCFTLAGLQYGRKGESLTLHSLRHTFATWMAQESVPFHVIAKLMGNTAAVVMRHYAHHAPDDISRAMLVISQKARST